MKPHVARFDNYGIFGDIFDEKKRQKFGRGCDTTLNLDNLESAKKKFQSTRVRDQKSFDMYVDRNVELDEIMMNTKMISNIVSMDELRYKSATSFKAYRDLKLENEPMPVLDKVSYQDYLPNRIKRKQGLL